MNTLILGANGFTGRRILQHLASRGHHTLTGSSLREDILPGNTHRFVQADINNHPAIEQLIAEIRPDVVINSAALSVPDYCESHQAEAHAINALATEHIARCCEQSGSRFIHLSTDFVFDGEKESLYTEEDIPSPINYYGISKHQGELVVAANCSNYANVRVVVVYGKAWPGQHGNILQLVKNRLLAGQEIRVVSDQYRTPTWVQDIAAGVEKLMHVPLNGTWHICGGECLSIADMAYRVADYFQLNRSLIVPVTTAEMNEATPRPRFSGLSIEKARRELGYTPHSLEEGMAEMRP